MFQYRISKYNPELRDDNQSYTREEWTSYSDIGKNFADGQLTQKEYLKVEKDYMDFIYDFFNAFKIKKVRILNQKIFFQKLLLMLMINGYILYCRKISEKNFGASLNQNNLKFIWVTISICT